MAAAGISNISPYPGFAGATLLSALYPYPQFGNLVPTGSATGNSHYDSLQIKVNKRLSHGLQAGGAYTWAKGLVRANPEDFFNARGSEWVLQQIPPQALTFNATYTMPKFRFLPKAANIAINDWQIGFFAQYQSGQFLLPPASPTANFLPSQDVRTGQPLYLKDINDIHSYNPYTDIILNPAAWAPCTTNSVCGGAYTSATGAVTSSRFYSDFRGPRQPRENANIGRHFRVGKEGRYDFYIRGEFVNIFNRTIMPNPSAGQAGGPGPQLAPSKNAVGVYTGGFGVINAYNAPGSAPTPTAGAVNLLGRTGTLIARFTF
jgi:hypothetical protein